MAKKAEATDTWEPRFTEKGEQIEPLLVVEEDEGFGLIENPEYKKSTRISP